MPRPEPQFSPAIPQPLWKHEIVFTGSYIRPNGNKMGPRSFRLEMPWWEGLSKTG